MEFIVVFALIGLVPAMIAASKGGTFAAWWIYGALLFPIALVHSLLIKADQAFVDKSSLSSGNTQKCPFCAEIVRKEAKVCRYCQRDLPTAPVIAEAPLKQVEKLAVPGEHPSGSVFNWKGATLSLFGICLAASVFIWLAQDYKPADSADVAGVGSSTPSASYVSVQAAAGTPFEEVAIIEAKDPSVVQAGARQVTSSGYACSSAAHVWKLNFTRDVGMTILKVSCSDGADYQVTLLDKKAFAKPWTGSLMGGGAPVPDQPRTELKASERKAAEQKARRREAAEQKAAEEKVVTEKATAEKDAAEKAAAEKAAEDAQRRAAENGDAKAELNLAAMYFNGRGVPQDYTEAAKWYRIAAEKGDATAQINLGLMYYSGQGFPQDYTEAIKWYRLAAVAGDPNAQYYLGTMYANGEGGPKDLVRANMWLFFAVTKQGPGGRASTALYDIARKMTYAEKEQARLAAAECQRSLYKNCG